MLRGGGREGREGGEGGKGGGGGGGWVVGESSLLAGHMELHKNVLRSKHTNKHIITHTVYIIYNTPIIPRLIISLSSMLYNNIPILL